MQNYKQWKKSNRFEIKGELEYLLKVIACWGTNFRKQK